MRVCEARSARRASSHEMQEK